MVTNNAINTGKPIEVSNGGTSVASFTTYGPVVAASTSTGALTAVSPSATSGIPLISQGSASNPAFGTMVVAGGGTGLTTTTAYGLIAGGTTSTGAFQNVGTGTSGQVLKSNGAAALPTWVNADTSGSLVFLSSQTASNSASINFTSLISATYTTYLLMTSNCTSTSANDNLILKVSSNNGSTYLATGYTTGDVGSIQATGLWTDTNGTTSTQVTGANTSTGQPGAVATSWLFNVGNGQQFMYIGNRLNTFVNIQIGYTQSINTSTAVNAFQVLMVTGNISTGTFTLYGLVQ